MNETVTREEISRIVFGDHDDPFSVLGYQRIKLRGRGQTMHSVRAFVPDAEQIFLVCGDDDLFPMQWVHDAGFFEVLLDDPPSQVPYRLEAVYPDGSRMQMYDVYSFGPVMSTYDLHLIGEGTGEFIYTKLGAYLFVAFDMLDAVELRREGMNGFSERVVRDDRPVFRESVKAAREQIASTTSIPHETESIDVLLQFSV